MHLHWQITAKDVATVKKLAEKSDNALVRLRKRRNVDRQGIKLDQKVILNTMLMCLLTSQQRSGPESAVVQFLNSANFASFLKDLEQQSIEKQAEFTEKWLLDHKMTRFCQKNSANFIQNYLFLKQSNGELMAKLTELYHHPGREQEQKTANYLAKSLKGIGLKQSRNFLQALGLTQYETPIDSRILNWLKENVDFPLNVKYYGLQDPAVYRLIADGFQALSKKAGILPCMLDAMIFSAEDGDKWTDDNVVF